MARKDDLKMLFNFLIELLKDEEKIEETNDSDKNLICENTKKENKTIGAIDASRIKYIMDKIEDKRHDDAIVKQVEKHYKREIKDMKDAFHKELLKEEKLETPKENTNFSGGTVYSEFISKINL